jgi:hypothetical protein
MILRTFYNNVGVVTRVIYELPRHEEVHKDTKMRLLEKNGSWYVIAETLPKVDLGLYPKISPKVDLRMYSLISERKVTRSLAEDKD